MGLSPKEQAVLDKIRAELASGRSSTWDYIQGTQWSHPLPPARQLIEDDYYFGNVGKALYPILRTDLVDILEKPYTEVVCSGSIGWGKSFIAGLGVAIEMVRLACLRDPHRLIGAGVISPTTDLVMMNMSISGDQAGNLMGSYITSALKSSPFVTEVLKPQIKDKESAVFPCTMCFWTGRQGSRACPKCSGTGRRHLRYVSGNSNELSVIGENLVGGAMDEANFMISTRRSKRAKMANETDPARSLYTQIVRRRESRFIGSIDAELAVLPVFWVISSVQFPGEFTEERVAAARTNKRIKVLRYATWETKGSAVVSPYKGKRFVVFVGNGLHRSRIVSLDASTFNEKEFTVPENCHLIYIPTEHLGPFEDNINGAIRDIAGIPLLASNPYFERPVEPCYANASIGDIPREHPYEYTSAKLISAQLLLIEKLCKQVNGENRPLLHPDAYRYIHVDLAKSATTAGFAMGCFAGYKSYRRQILGKSKTWWITERRPITHIDYMQRICPPDMGRIDIEAILDLIYACREMGYRLRLVSYDRFESTTSINSLLSKGYDAVNYSVDLNPQCWTSLRDSIRDERIALYPYSPLTQELSAVELLPDGGIFKKRVALEEGAAHHCDVAECVAAICGMINEKHGVEREPLPAPLYEEIAQDLDDKQRMELNLISETMDLPDYAQRMMRDGVDPTKSLRRFGRRL
jgi:hypothetical protein